MQTFDVKSYWNRRYLTGGNSGAGSYGKLAIHKAEVISSIIEEFKIETVVELGCGDGNNLKILTEYISSNIQITGVDVSEKAIDLCKLKLPSHTFLTLEKYKPSAVDLVLSLDVIYHLVEDDIYEEYMKLLTDIEATYLLIYSSDFESNDYARHVRARNFSKHILLNSKYNLIKEFDNKYPLHKDPEGSFSIWKLYKNIQ